MKFARSAIAALLICTLLPILGAHASSIRHIKLTLNFNGFHSKAELTLPSGKGPFPAVLLVAGAGPGDMDYTVRTLQGKFVSHVMLRLAKRLSANGFAVLRYNKRCVRGVHDFDAACYRKLTQRDLAADAETALAALRARPEVNAKQVFLYGWSEGSVVVGTLTRSAHPAGVILQGPVFDPFAKVISWQVNDVLVPYLGQFAHHGLLDASAVQKALHGDAGLWLRRYLSALTGPDGHGLNPFLDANHDGELNVKAEIAPSLTDFVLESLGAPGTRLAPLKDDVKALSQVPVLVLQGMNDGSVPSYEGRRLDAALHKAHAKVALKLYPGLGHTLGPAASPAAEGFAPMAPKPLHDIVHWLRARAFPSK